VSVPAARPHHPTTRTPVVALIGLLVAALALVALIGASRAEAAAPPNRNDPCSTAGRNTCGTNGVGRHETYRYGIRWFGDFRGAVKDLDVPTFCIDLRFLVPSPASRFAPLAGGELRNRDGRRVALVNQRKMAYALWNYGRSDRVDQQAAVLLYVHSIDGGRASG